MLSMNAASERNLEHQTLWTARRYPFSLPSGRFTPEDLLQILAREQLDQTALIVARSRVGHLYKFEPSAAKLNTAAVVVSA
jgi:hypothetical protein